MFTLSECNESKCASRRDRTFDLILKRDLLYQLSYGRINKIYFSKKLFQVPGVGVGDYIAR